MTSSRYDTLWASYKLRWNRRRYLYRCWRARRDLARVSGNLPARSGPEIRAFACVRNEALRLPYWLAHHRRLGVSRFFIVDNASTDGTAEQLATEPDVCLWRTDASYRDARFGLDWIGALLIRYGHGHWCLTLDADELFIYPDWDQRNLSELTAWLDRKGQESFGALMLDLYPKGPISAQSHAPEQDPVETLPWFDAYPYWAQRQPKLHNLWLQGGPRARVFFHDTPDRAPTLNKIPLVKWSRRYAYVNSTHRMLPRRLNHVYDVADVAKPSGVLLHTKFLPDATARAAEEIDRKQHFGDPAVFAPYHRALRSGPDFWTDASLRYDGWRQLCALGLMQGADWL